MLAKILLELMTIDRGRTSEVVKTWQQYISTSIGNSSNRGFSSLEDYVPWRIVNVGGPYAPSVFMKSLEHKLTRIRMMIRLMTYGMALTINESEWNLMMPIATPLLAGLAMANDYFSWQKEYDQSRLGPEVPYITNAIWVLMQEHRTTAEEAKQMSKGIIVGYYQEYIRLKTELLHSTVVPLDVRKSLSALELMIPGNVAWSQFTPRYQFSRTASDSHSKTVVYGSQHSLHGPHNETNGEHLILESHMVKNTQNDPGILPFASSDSSGTLVSRVQALLNSKDQVKASPFKPSKDRSGEAVELTHNVPRMHIGEHAAVLTRHSLPKLDEEASPRIPTL